jgi:DNA-binding transcriptional ArsR family regulator
MDGRNCQLQGLIPVEPQRFHSFRLTSTGSAIFAMDPFERLLWWLFAGSTGAETRAHVLRSIKEQPRNAQQLSEMLGLDYTTVRHHLKVLQQNRLVITEGEKYGKLYFLSDAMEANWNKLDEILEKTRKSNKVRSEEGSQQEEKGKDLSE